MNKKNVLIGVGIVVMVVLCIGIAIFAGKIGRASCRERV